MNEKNEYDIELLKKYMKNVHNISDITKENINTIIKYIRNANKSESWKEGKLFSLERYFASIGRKTKLIKKNAVKTLKKRKTDEQQQGQTEKEKDNYLTYEELNELRKRHEIYYDIESMYQYLLLSAICLDQPPLRPQIYVDLTIIYDKKKMNKTDNYMILDKNKKTGLIYINDDKVSRKRDIKFSKDNEVIMEPLFTKVVFETLEKYNRNKLFEFDVDNKEHKILKMLQDITKNKFTFNMARSSYVTYWWKNHHDAKLTEKIYMAKQMRHTVAYQEMCYRKFDAVSGNLEKIDKKINDENDNEEEKEQESEKTIKTHIYNKLYYANKNNITLDNKFIIKYGIQKNEKGEYVYKKEDSKDKEKDNENVNKINLGKPKTSENEVEFNRRRKSVINMANKKNTQIKVGTCEYYGIKYDENDKKWV